MIQDRHHTPFFTVVIPAYNRSSTIGPTLDSVRAQIFRDFECIVVDDGSSDAPELSKVVSEYDDRFRYVWQENGGGGAARNKGIELARGRYIAFLDSDDFFTPDKLEYFSTVNMDERTVFYSLTTVDRGSGRTWIRPDRSIQPSETVGEYLFVYNQFIQTSTIVMSANLARHVRFDPNLRKGQDLDFCLRLEQAGAMFKMIRKPLSVWVDKSEENRTSRHGGYKAPMEWLRSWSSYLGEKAVAGYRANVLAYYLGRERPLLAIHYLFRGACAGVPLKVILRQAARCFLPRATYRRLVNSVIELHGRGR